jgi:hypothetical protein
MEHMQLQNVFILQREEPHDATYVAEYRRMRAALVDIVERINATLDDMREMVDEPEVDVDSDGEQ